MNLILLLDCSSSMKDQKRGALTDAAINLIQMFQSEAYSHNEVRGWIGAMTFGGEIDFYPLKPAKDFTLTDPECKGRTKMGEMFAALSEELSTNQVFSSTGDSKNILVLISDGGAADVLSDGFRQALRTPEFINSRRISISIGPNVDNSLLSSFCTFAEDIFTSSHIESAMEIIRYTINKLVSPKPSLKYEPHKIGETFDWD